MLIYFDYLRSVRVVPSVKDTIERALRRVSPINLDVKLIQVHGRQFKDKKVSYNINTPNWRRKSRS